MKYMSILLDETAYSELRAFRDSISKKAKKSISFSEAVERAVGRTYLLMRLDPDLRSYIERFIEEAKKDRDVLGMVLFGSVAKGTATRYSDIDILILVKRDVWGAYDRMHGRIMSLNGLRYGLIKKGIFNYISPTIIDIKDTESFKPFFLDVADYGIIVSDSDKVVERFIEKTSSIRHRREYSPYGEVLRWKIKE